MRCDTASRPTLLERGTDIRIIQALLGHDKLDTTARYTRVATGMIARIESPLDLLSLPRKKPKKNPGKKLDIGENDQPPAQRPRQCSVPSWRSRIAVPLIPVDAIKAVSATASMSAQPEEPKAPEHPCPCCGSNMRIIETFLRGQQPKHKPTPIPPKIRIDTS